MWRYPEEDKRSLKKIILDGDIDWKQFFFIDVSCFIFLYYKMNYTMVDSILIKQQHWTYLDEFFQNSNELWQLSVVNIQCQERHLIKLHLSKKKKKIGLINQDILNYIQTVWILGLQYYVLGIVLIQDTLTLVSSFSFFGILSLIIFILVPNQTHLLMTFNLINFIHRPFFYASIINILLVPWLILIDSFRHSIKKFDNCSIRVMTS